MNFDHGLVVPHFKKHSSFFVLNECSRHISNAVLPCNLGIRRQVSIPKKYDQPDMSFHRLEGKNKSVHTACQRRSHRVALQRELCDGVPYFTRLKSPPQGEITHSEKLSCMFALVGVE